MDGHTVDIELIYMPPHYHRIFTNFRVFEKKKCLLSTAVGDGEGYDDDDDDDVDVSPAYHRLPLPSFSSFGVICFRLSLCPFP